MSMPYGWSRSGPAAGRRSGPGRRELGLSLVRADTLGAPPEQGDGAAGVAAAGVGQPDRDLG